ncbi:MAG: ATP-binding cassette domain-containing protein [Chitinophagaceae bacterium]|nr:ATP-binding cassette domain-containing protein [Chitinophagaceae bacterium]HQV60095.1 ATP-binding cassette domain-containing protein [Chitinophagaceae bacterium]HQV85484.1 ATP-binding cassette domain-containing protein [Chitinophagaceae bacterium]HQZ74652.1 ATP-binding cassette domain-containing protein [Chitinophagaceae bacterium]
MSIVLSIKNIAKSYGSVRALNGVSFDVPQGSVFGILGPNGSGKTTLLGIVMDVLKANTGDFDWFGQPGSPEQRKKIGSLLETPNFYSYMSAIDNLKITQSISGRGTSADIDAVLKKVNLYDRRRYRFNSYSLGMKQRLAIGAALLGNPKVLVLDEPTNGLDPVGIAEIRQLIIELRDQGHTIIMASHLLDEVEKVCTHVAILKSGNLLTTGNVEEVMMDEDIVELSAADLTALTALFRKREQQIIFDERANTLQVILPKGTAKMEDINRLCFENGIVLNHLILKKKRLEARFFELTNN